MTKPDINPDPSPEWIRDTIAEPMVQAVREAGGIPDGRAIDVEVQRMIARHDAEEREDGSHLPRVPVKRGKDVAAEMAKKAGATFVRDDSLLKRQGPQKVERLSPWQAALRNRIRALCSRLPGTVWRQAEFRHPRFAKVYLTEYMRYSTRSKHYQYMSDRDAERQLSRFSEDIADRSTPVLGGWR